LHQRKNESLIALGRMIPLGAESLMALRRMITLGTTCVHRTEVVGGGLWASIS
jgi:hypothetical protein